MTHPTHLMNLPVLLIIIIAPFAAAWIWTLLRVSARMDAYAEEHTKQAREARRLMKKRTAELMYAHLTRPLCGVQKFLPDREDAKK